VFEVICEAIITLNGFAILMAYPLHSAVDGLNVETSGCAKSDPSNMVAGFLAFPNKSSYHVPGLESEDLLRLRGFAGREA
jgi:hypothetical protein